MSAVQIYSLPQVVMLTYGVGASTLNFPINRTDFKLYRGLTNPIQVLIRNVDRAPVLFPAGQTPMVTIIQRDTKKLLYTGPLTLIDGNQSLWTFTINPSDIADWTAGWCTYTVTILDSSTNLQAALFMDRGYSLNGSVEIIDGPYPPSPSSVLVTPDLTLISDGSIYSTAIPGAAQLGNLSGLHTMAFYGDNFTGNLTIQALLDATPITSASQWLTIASLDFSAFSGIKKRNFEGNFYWIRFCLYAASGAWTKILVRS